MKWMIKCEKRGLRIIARSTRVCDSTLGDTTIGLENEPTVLSKQMSDFSQKPLLGNLNTNYPDHT